MKITGADLFVKSLIKENVDILFAYPGGQVIDLFDALYGRDEFRVILPRHEQGLIHAADGYARSTGSVGVCLVTSGPGATNLVTGIATANYDSVPLVCFTGQVSTDLIGNDAFQEVDIVGITRPITKYAVTVRNREELGPVIKKAFQIARTGKPGVVIVDIPKDIQKELGTDKYPEKVDIRGYKPSVAVHTGQLSRAMKVLEEAKRPLFLAGGGVNVANAQKVMLELAEKTQIPVVTTIMGKGSIPTSHPLYIGNVGIHGSYAANSALSDCDVLFSIGTRFNDRITGKLNEFASNKTIIHVDVDPASISKNIAVNIPIVADAGQAIVAMLERSKPFNDAEWLTEIQSRKELHPVEMRYPGLTPQIIIEKINKIFDNSIIVTDVGQNQLWCTQFLALDTKRQMLTSGGLGTMGYGFPAALGAKLGNPDKNVLVITGDGGFQMNLQELATAVIEKIPVIICILNNGCLGNVRQWQEMFFEKRYSYTNLTNDSGSYVPDFVKFAESYGVTGIRITREEEIDEAFIKANKVKDCPVLLEFIIDSTQNVLPIVPPGKSLKEMISTQEKEESK